jgi:hypothetical protein
MSEDLKLMAQESNCRLEIFIHLERQAIGMDLRE